jgi:hypothetical protein
MSKALTRAERTAVKHQEIRRLFAERYTNQKRVNGARIYTSAYVIACLAEQFYLSMRQIENIIYTKTITAEMPAAAAPGAGAAGGHLSAAA